MNFDAAIFDLDGTLLDTLGVWDGILAAPLERRGLPCPPDYVKRVHSLSFEEAAEYTAGRFELAEPPGTFLREWDELALGEYAHRGEDFYDAYLFPAPDPLPAFVLQREEVADAKWVTFGELLSMRSRGELHPLLDYCGILGAYLPARGG